MTGYGLTFGLHTRLDATIDYVTARVRAGNLYVNRNIIGAVVGVQPFGGRGLSGTGPKAGGPLYLGRLVATAPAFVGGAKHRQTLLPGFIDWLEASGEAEAAATARLYGERSPLGAEQQLAGPVGERNLYRLRPRGLVLMRPATRRGLFEQMAAVLACGNRGRVQGMALPEDLPAGIAATFSGKAPEICAAVLVEGGAAEVQAVVKAAAAIPGPIISVQAAAAGPRLAYSVDMLLDEISISINTTAAGGNASLMMLG